MMENKRINENEEDEEQEDKMKTEEDEKWEDKMKTEEDNAAAVEVEKVDTSIT
jgi:hypothetical protein